jgi:MarR-like DNA-binding transcriptional regulator SgrR of sgrS sRNA
VAARPGVGVILPREWQSMENFSAMPVGTGPYAVVRNNQNQLKIHAFDDYFGYRALIDEVNVWVLPEISEEPNGGLTLQGPTQSEKAVESRLEEGATICCLMPAAPGQQPRGSPVAQLSVTARQSALSRR